MRWSFPLCRVFGIAIRVHLTFFILPPFVFVVFYREWQASVLAGLFGVLLTLILFVCVVAHEIGHSLAARLFGVKTRSIVLLPIGGVALLEQIPREAHKEIVIALAGPAVSLATAGLIAAGAWLLDYPLEISRIAEPSLSALAASLFSLNLWLTAFNLIPAFPMDGGRVFRGLLGLVFGWEKGTRWAARVGQAIAIVFVAWSFAPGGHPGFLLVGFFVFFGASEEGRLAQIRTSLQGATVEQAMVRSFVTLAPDETLLAALVKAVEYNQSGFPIVDGSTLLGMASYERILGGLKRHGSEAPVRLVMGGDFMPGTPELDLEICAMEILKQGRATIPVLRDGVLVGLLSWEHVSRFSQIREHVRAAAAALAKRQPPADSTL